MPTNDELGVDVQYYQVGPGGWTRGYERAINEDVRLGRHILVHHHKIDEPCNDNCEYKRPTDIEEVK